MQLLQLCQNKNLSFKFQNFFAKKLNQNKIFSFLEFPSPKRLLWTHRMSFDSPAENLLGKFTQIIRKKICTYLWKSFALQTSSGHVERSFDKPQDNFFRNSETYLVKTCKKPNCIFSKKVFLGKKRLSGHVNFSSENVAENFLPELWRKLAQFL